MSQNKWGKSFRKFLDLFLPRGVQQVLIEEMTVEDFLHKARRNRKRLGENIIAIFSYKDPLVKSAIWQIKYRNHSKIARLLAEILYSELIGELADLSQFAYFKEPILVPIPMSAARLKTRGYNQTENLAREIMRRDEGRSFELLTETLTRTKETLPQSSLPRTLRLKNLRGCFEVKTAEKIRDRNIILIDDVITTGATLGEASSTLFRAGARKVIAMVVAH